MFKNINQSFEESEKNESWILSDCFQDVTSKENYDDICDSLKNEKYLQKIKAIANIFNCEEESVCLISRKKAILNDKKTDVICTMNTYNDELRDILKSTGTARFDQYNKFWKIKDSKENRMIIKDLIPSFFKIIVDCESMKVMENKLDISASYNPEPFLTLPYHIKVSFDEIIDSVSIIKPSDYDKINSMYLYDGDRFINCNSLRNVFWSQSPFLLLRYNLEHGQPRYIVYSTIGKSIGEITFHNEINERNKIIAKFKSKSKISGNVFIKNKGEKTIPDNKKNIMKLRSEFIKYKDNETLVNSILKDSYAFPLSNNYVDTNGHIGDHKFVGAYASQDYKHMEMSKNIAKYFGYKDSYKHFFPIVFNSEHMDLFDEEDFTFVMVHEIAHYIEFEGKEDFEDLDISECDDSHNLAWIFSNNLLYSLIEKRPIETNIEHYRYEIFEDVDIGSLHELIDAIVEYTFYEILDEGHDKKCSIEYLCQKVKKCLESFKNIFEND